MLKFKLSLHVALFLLIKNLAFASVCLKNDMNGSNNSIPVYVSDNNGNSWSRMIRISNIYVSKNFVPKLRVNNPGAWVYKYDNYNQSGYRVGLPDLIADNSGVDLEDGDMVHIGGNFNQIPYISWIEKGNCNGRAPT